MLKAAVIGAGFMGELHCKIYSSTKELEFTGIYEADKKRAGEMADKYNTTYFEDLEDLIDKADIISIAVPTVLHHKYALQCLEKNKHLLIEKPIAATLSEAEEIVAAVEKRGLTAAVGYIERFNPAVAALFKLVKQKEILSIETRRMAPPAKRANDVSVVFDLIIHDLDIILSLIGSSVTDVRATGKRVGSKVINDAMAEISFESGAKALAVSSKAAEEKTRTVRVTCSDIEVLADLITKELQIINADGSRRSIVASGGEPIREEIEDFISAVRTNTKPRVCAGDSLKSFVLAREIEKKCL